MILPDLKRGRAGARRPGRGDAVTDASRARALEDAVDEGGLATDDVLDRLLPPASPTTTPPTTRPPVATTAPPTTKKPVTTAPQTTECKPAGKSGNCAGGAN